VTKDGWTDGQCHNVICSVLRHTKLEYDIHTKRHRATKNKASAAAAVLTADLPRLFGINGETFINCQPRTQVWRHCTCLHVCSRQLDTPVSNTLSVSTFHISLLRQVNKQDFTSHTMHNTSSQRQVSPSNECSSTEKQKLSKNITRTPKTQKEQNSCPRQIH